MHRTVYFTVLEVEDQLLCSTLQDQAGDAFDTPRSSFKHFQQELRLMTLEVEQKRMLNMDQKAMHDVFKQ